MAAVTAIPLISYVAPPRVSDSPTCTPSTLANPASTTTPPGLIQPPSSSRGLSTDEAATSRPSTSALPSDRAVRSSVHVPGNGPLCAATPAALVSASRLAAASGAPPEVPLVSPGRTAVAGPDAAEPSAKTVATTSGPLVAARVRA